MNCPTAKIAYVSRREAIQVQKQMRHNQRAMKPYLCFCGYWHLGHRPMKKPRGHRYP